MALLFLALIYMGQVAGVARETLAILAKPKSQQAQFSHTTYDFFVTREAWILAHLWLLWIAVLQLVRHPKQRGRIVGAVAAALLAVLAATWSIAAWLGRHGAFV
jgi:hypothetical protein